MEKNYVRIHSEVNITVTCGLNHLDVTNPDAHVADRLKVSPSWPTCSVQISQGSHVYPAIIATWDTVKALARDKIISIAEFIEDTNEDDVKAKSETLAENMKAAGIEVKESRKKNKSLSDIAEE